MAILAMAFAPDFTMLAFPAFVDTLRLAADDGPRPPLLR